MKSTLRQRVSYNVPYIDDVDGFLARIRAKTIIPAQIEIQPGRLKGRELCWMSCPYCYGASAKDDGQRLSPERYCALMEQAASGPHGKVGKVIFGGYATDPLNYEHIDDLVALALRNRQISGFHSKLLRISDRLVGLLTGETLPPLSYMTISVDAGNAKSYNLTHGIVSTKDIYGKVLDNIRALTSSRKDRNSGLDITANYLVTRVNNSSEEVETGIRNLVDAGVDLVRLSFPQLPRGTEAEQDTIIPTRAEIREIYDRLKPIVESFQAGPATVMMVDFEAERSVTERRTLPCFARFVYPTISFDGYLAHCSQSAAPHFRSMSLANLANTDFWDAYYDYDPSDLAAMLERQQSQMEANDCRCDRKEHTFNRALREGSALLSEAQPAVAGEAR